MAERDVIVSRSEALYQINMFLWNMKATAPVIDGVTLLPYGKVLDGITRIMVSLEPQNQEDDNWEE